MRCITPLSRCGDNPAGSLIAGYAPFGDATVASKTLQ
jgi:hypothetical protein